VARTQNNLNTTSPLIAREVYQALKDVALGTRTMTRACNQSWCEIYHGFMAVEIDGWRLTLSYVVQQYSTKGLTRCTDGAKPVSQLRLQVPVNSTSFIFSKLDGSTWLLEDT